MIQKRRTIMKQMMIAIAGLLAVNVAVYAQEMKPRQHHRDSTKVEQQKVVAADVYVCPMHKDVTSAKPGKCPKCKMALVKKETAKPAVMKPTYTCPMHPDVKSDKPGKCPKCKMAMVLEKKSK
jgi:uncharacterized paraquat-inducible protein A